MAAIIAAAEGRISKRDVYEMLTIPSKHSWIVSAAMAPAYGLYLSNVEYPAELLEPNSNVAYDSDVSLSEEVSVA